MVSGPSRPKIGLNPPAALSNDFPYGKPGWPLFAFDPTYTASTGENLPSADTRGGGARAAMRRGWRITMDLSPATPASRSGGAPGGVVPDPVGARSTALVSRRKLSIKFGKPASIGSGARGIEDRR